MSAAAPQSLSRRPSFPWRPSTRLAYATLLGAALILLPLAALVGSALSLRQAAEIWPHLAAHVLPTALIQTGLLLAGVGALSAAIGVGAAWLVTQSEFPGRGALEWLLALPLALPTYITAYIYVEFMGFNGPLQGALRAATGWRSLREYWFPEPRSLPGAIVIMALVLYPYVYLSVRALFVVQSAAIIDAARTLGAGRGRLFRHVGLPLARPALAAGLILVLLETLNDIGASEYLGIRTLTLSIYTTWLNRGSLAGASQIACVMLLLVFALLLGEARLRERRGFAISAQPGRIAARRRLGRGAGMLAALACLLPVLLGAVLPVGFLIAETLRLQRLAGLDPALLGQLGNALLLAMAASLIVLALGFGIAAAARRGQERFLRLLARFAGLGYAVPGTVLALGVLIPVAAIDNLVADTLRRWFGREVGLVLIGSGAALLVAYAARFLAIGINGIESGLARIPRRVDDAARSLGAGGGVLLRQFYWPLARPAIATAGLLVFVDVLKELPATLLLRPLGVETLATTVYGHASRGVFEEGAPAALLIVLAGLVPALILARIRPAQKEP
ncbi:ABC transporter permease [Bosea minatitlanensis]|uniref:ABC transporter permease n=1 Tax=Bosea minatitlanensis TaxID=128782 RepID=A0ABW0F819_9HYPH|nr:iron ABC transporter permease [Bosea minatitlanensis]MCT4493793.1 iron ABC transporter permease [Bosea minatitlanensis]